MAAATESRHRSHSPVPCPEEAPRRRRRPDPPPDRRSCFPRDPTPRRRGGTPMDAPDRSGPAPRVHRRSFLKTAVAAGIGSAAGIEGILAAGRTPAHAQVTKVHLL